MISASGLSKRGIFHYNHFNSSWIVVKIVIVIPFDLDRALQSKPTTVGDYRRGPEPDRLKARCRAGTVRGRGTSSATEQVSADENLWRFIPSKSPLPSRSSLPWSRLSHNFFFLWRHSFCQPCPWSKLTFGELAIMVGAIGPLLIGLYCICIRNKQKTLLYKGRHF